MTADPTAKATNESPGTTSSSLGLTIGFGLIGLSAFALMAAGPRVLGQDGYTELALAYTAITIIGVGITTPGEQVITRFVAAGSGTGTVRSVRRRLIAMLPLVLVLLPMLGGDGTGAGSIAMWIAAVLLAALGWIGIALTRGLLAGGQCFREYTATLVIEAMARLVLVIAALLLPAAGTWLLAAAVSLPLIASAAVGWWWARSTPNMTDASYPEDSRAEQFNMTAVALLIQICLSTAQLWLSRQSADPAISGAFVTVTSYMRVPVMLAGGLMAPLLTAAAKAYAQRRPRDVAIKTAEALAVGSGGTAVLLALLLALQNLAMLILYGGDTGLPLATFVWLGVSTLGFIAANVLTNSLYGCQRAGTAVLVWILPALLTTALFALAGGDPTRLAAAAAIGQLTAVALLATALAFALRPDTRR